MRDVCNALLGPVGESVVNKHYQKAKAELERGAGFEAIEEAISQIARAASILKGPHDDARRCSSSSRLSARARSPADAAALVLDGRPRPRRAHVPGLVRGRARAAAGLVPLAALAALAGGARLACARPAAASPRPSPDTLGCLALALAYRAARAARTRGAG